MKRSLIVLLAVSILFFSSEKVAFATNGANLIGLSAASQAQGGTGVANFTDGTDAIYKNPALLSGVAGTIGNVQVEVGATYINQSSTAGNGAVSATSSASSKFGPQVAATYRATEALTFGLGALAFGGAVSDFTGQAAANSGGTDPFDQALISLNQLKVDMDLMRLALVASYKLTDQITVGVSPFLTYGAFVINEDIANGTQTARSPHGAFGYGVEAGVSVKPSDNWTVGATFTSKSAVTYNSLIDLDLLGPNNPTLGGSAALYSGLDNVELDQPMEIGAGASFKATSDLTVSVDYRFINWSKTLGYGDFLWQDQNVFGVGGQYKMDNIALRVGYNYGRSPVQPASNQAGQTSVNIQGHQVFTSSIAKFDTVAFPAISEHHITLGAGWQPMENCSVDASFMFSPINTVLQSGTFDASSYGASKYSYAFQAQATQFSAALTAMYRF